MIARIALTDADKLRYGVAVDHLELDLDRISATEAAMVQAKTRRPIRQVIKGLWELIPVLDAGGDPVLDAAGNPLHLVDIDSQIMVVWIGLRRIGHPTSWENACEFDIFHAHYDLVLSDEERAGPTAADPEPESDEAVDPDPGKALQAAE